MIKQIKLNNIRYFSIVVFFLVLPIISCAEISNSSNSPMATSATTVKITVDPSKVLHKTNPLILGNNIQWVDRADGLLDPSSGEFKQDVIDKLKYIKITALRFPGGTLSDVYHWKETIGPVSQRKKGLHVERKAGEDSFFGVDEFLKLSKIFGSEPLITVNTFTGTADEAAEWVNYANKTQAARVKYWEIGNEPYLDPPDKSPKNPNYPEIFAKKFIEFATRMKLVDPSIQVGLPLRSDLLGRYPGGAYQNWNKRVLSICGQYADFVALHDAYFPTIFKQEEFQEPGSFQTLLAAPEEVDRDIREVKQMLSSMFPSKTIKIAITEHNNFFAVPGMDVSKSTASLAGGLYTASLLTHFFKDDSILMANFWSLTGNWLFGALNQKDRPRPQFYALKIFSDFVGENVIDLAIQNNLSFNSPAAGYMPQETGVPIIEVLATTSGKSVFIIVINKSLNQNIPLSVALSNFQICSGVPIDGVVMSGASIKSDNEQGDTVGIMPIKFQTAADLTRLVIPRHSVIAFRVDGA